MRIIGGAARSIPLDVPPGLAVRPTADRAREALFNSLGSINGFVVWDLFAGSGAVGLECASRGAKLVTFVELEKNHCDFIQRNIDRVRRSVPGVATNIVNSPVSRVRWQGAPPDLIFGDPPYAESLNEFKQLMNNNDFKIFAANAKLVWEIPDHPGALGEFLLAAPLQRAVRRFGGVNFLIVNKME